MYVLLSGNHCGLLRVFSADGVSLLYAVGTCEIKLYENYLNLRRRPSEILLFRRKETCLKLCQNYYRSS